MYMKYLSTVSYFFYSCITANDAIDLLEFSSKNLSKPIMC